MASPPTPTTNSKHDKHTKHASSCDPNALPGYSGPFQVSVTDVEWTACFSHDIRTDVTFPDAYPKSVPDELRTDCDSILVRIHYPSTVKPEHLKEDIGNGDGDSPLLPDQHHAQNSHDGEKVPWLPEPRYAKGYGVIAGIPPIVGRLIGLIALRNTHIPVTLNGPLLGRHVHPCTDATPSAKASSSSTQLTELTTFQDQSLPRFPVVIFSHGLSSCRTTLSGICGELASYGSVVFAIEHRDASASFTVLDKGTSRERELIYEREPKDGGTPWEHRFRNAQVRHRTQEVLKTMELIYLLEHGHSHKIRNLYHSTPLATFHHRLDLTRMSLTGHSFGGCTVLEVTARYRTLPFDLAVAMDAWATPLTLRTEKSVAKLNAAWQAQVVHAGPEYAFPTIPTLYLNSGHFHWPNNLAVLDAYVYNPAQGIDNPWYTLVPATHQSFSDAGLLPIFHKPGVLRWFARRVLKIPDTPLTEADYRVWVFANQTRRYLQTMRDRTCDAEATCVPELIEGRVRLVKHKGCTVDDGLLSTDEGKRFRDVDYGFPGEGEEEDEASTEDDTSVMDQVVKQETR